MDRQGHDVAGAVVLAVSILLLGAGPVGAHYPLAGGRIHVGPNPNPPPWSSDNGNPGNALPIYEGYHWPSLRQALDQYGLFGRKACGRGGVEPSWPVHEAGVAEETPLPGAVTAEPRPAVLVVCVPPDAELWVAGQQMAERGSVRQLVTPPLEWGRRFSYAIEARWTEGGRDVRRRQTIEVYAGDRRTIDLLGSSTPRTPGAAPQPPALPEAVP